MLKKIKNVIREQLTMGATPEKLSQSLVGGILIGIFPLLGTTTVLATLIAFWFKLNHVVIQTVNYLIYPIQILMIPIYIKVVSLIFDVGDVPLRPDMLIRQFKASPSDFLKQYSLIAVYAVLLWSILSVVLYFILYPAILKIILKFKKKK